MSSEAECAALVQKGEKGENAKTWLGKRMSPRAGSLVSY